MRERFFPFSINNTNLVKEIKNNFAQSIKFAYYKKILECVNFDIEIIDNKNEFQENDKLESNLSKIRTSSKEAFSEIYKNTLNIDNIIKAIDDNNVYRKKDDIKVLCNSINLELDTQLYNMITITKEDFNNKDTSKTSKISSNITACGINIVPTFKLLNTSSLNFLNIMGISISFLPSVVFILSGFMSFSGNWKKTLAKKVIKAYEEENVTSKYNKVIDEYFANYLANIKEIDSKRAEILKYQDDPKLYKNIKTILSNFAEYVENAK